MELSVERSANTRRIRINDPRPIVSYEFKGKTEKTNQFSVYSDKISIQEKEGKIVISKNLGVKEHILGLGEKAFETDRRRTKTLMWNTDAFAYGKNEDPLYVSIPFFISVSKGKTFGLFVNSASMVEFDIGVEDYGKINITVPETSVEMYVFEGKTIEEIIEEFTDLTGKPFRIPDWALGHMISRYSYYPAEKVAEVVGEYMKYAPVSAVFLDIDHMEKHRDFTWSKEFGDPKKLIESLHKKGVKVVTIVDPMIAANQEYDVFKRGLGNYVENKNGDLYLGAGWSGDIVYPDYLNKKAREWWTSEIKRWVEEYDLDGIWLDMNDPANIRYNDVGIRTLLSAKGLKDYEIRTIDTDALHTDDEGRKIKHLFVHNAYSLLEAEATFASRVPFILSRSGYAGIQKYAAIWSGDNTSSWEHMRLQIPLLTGLSISGVPYVGCDIGGFVGRSDPELLARYYQVAAFFPIFRNHKMKGGNDQEIYMLPDKYRDMAIRAVQLRQKFMKYLASLADEASKKGHPMIRPLCYDYFDDENTFGINDEYMVGKYLLYAPIVEEGASSRMVYLPKGRWYNWWNKEEISGGKWIEAREEMPLYVNDLKYIKSLVD